MNVTYLIRKRCMTLMEVLVATALLSVLLIILLSSYRQMSQINVRLSQRQSERFQLRYLEYRLASLLPKALCLTRKTATPTNNNHCFYISEDANEYMKPGSLVFAFASGVDIDAFLSERDVLARLYVDQQKQLCLALWPFESEEQELIPPMRKEILLGGVEELSFLFYFPPHPEGHKVVTERVNPGKNPDSPDRYDEWHPKWESYYSEVPPLVKVFVKYHSSMGNVEELVYAFVLYNSAYKVTYKNEEMRL